MDIYDYNHKQWQMNSVNEPLFEIPMQMLATFKKADSDHPLMGYRAIANRLHVISAHADKCEKWNRAAQWDDDEQESLHRLHLEYMNALEGIHNRIQPMSDGTAAVDFRAVLDELVGLVNTGIGISNTMTRAFESHYDHRLDDIHWSNPMIDNVRREPVEMTSWKVGKAA